MSLSRLEKSLYRSVFRLCRNFDKQPSSKLLFHRFRDEIDDKKSDGEVNAVVYDNFIEPMLLGKELYLPNDQTSMLQILRHRVRKNELPRTEITQNGYSLLRYLSTIWSSYKKMDSKSTNIAEVNADTKATFAVRKEPEPGVLLISHPLVPGTLKRTVILLLSHDKSAGSYGLVLNRPTQYTLKNVVKNLPKEVFNVFGHRPVAYGGNIRRLQYMHFIPNCEGVPVPLSTSPVFYAGKLPKLIELLKTEPKVNEDIVLFAGSCVWDYRKLNNEIKKGRWIVVESQPDKLLRILQRNLNSLKNASKSTEKSATHSEDIVNIYDLALGSLDENYKTLLKMPAWMDAKKIVACNE